MIARRSRSDAPCSTVVWFGLAWFALGLLCCPQDAKLVPLWRAMATYADMSARGMEITLDTPDDMQPWQ